MKYLLIIGDGMADNPVSELGGKTPLEYLQKPAMDALASAAGPGHVRTCPEGLPPGSDTGILSIFGCDTRNCYTGRAPLEAAASGIKLSPGDIAYRCNMVTLEDGGAPFGEKRILSHSAGSIDGKVSERLVTALWDDPAFKKFAEKAGMRVYPAQSFRHIAVQSGASAAGMILAPPHDHLGESIGDFLPSGSENAAVILELMRLSHTVLDKHPINEQRRADGLMPANAIWLWGEGTAVKLLDFTEKYGKTGGVISAVPLCQGIAALIGLETVYVEGATGELDTNYEGKIEAAMETLKRHPFAAVHIEAPDECTHDGNLEGKLEAIRRLDSRVVAPLVQKLRASGEDFRILLMPDHKTLTSTRRHDGTPVPYVLYDSRTDKKTGMRYCEKDGERGAFIPDAAALMGVLFEI